MKFDIYVDGSYSKDNNANVTFGGIVIVRDDSLVACQRCKTRKPEWVGMWNVGGELLAAMYALVSCRAISRKSTVDEQYEFTIYYDYNGIGKFVSGEWRTKTEPTKEYKALYNKIAQECKNMSVDFVKVKAHSGIVWNELADAVAGGRFDQTLQSVRLPDCEL